MLKKFNYPILKSGISCSLVGRREIFTIRRSLWNFQMESRCLPLIPTMRLGGDYAVIRTNGCGVYIYSERENEFRSDIFFVESLTDSEDYDILIKEDEEEKVKLYFKNGMKNETFKCLRETLANCERIMKSLTRRRAINLSRAANGVDVDCCKHCGGRI